VLCCAVLCAASSVLHPWVLSSSKHTQRAHVSPFPCRCWQRTPHGPLGSTCKASPSRS
jgi:hypothetical protein